METVDLFEVKESTKKMSLASKMYHLKRVMRSIQYAVLMASSINTGGHYSNTPIFNVLT